MHARRPPSAQVPRAGPRPLLHFRPEEVRAAIVTCGGLCPGLNDVIYGLVRAPALRLRAHMHMRTHVRATPGGCRPAAVTVHSLGHWHGVASARD